MRIFIMTLALLVAACGGKGQEGDCSPGQTADCTCPSGETGTMTCGEDGWGPCECLPADTGTDGDDPVDEPDATDAEDAADGPCTGVSPVVSEARVSNTTGDSEIPALAWTGSEIGVAWLDGVIGATTVQFVRVDASGAVVGDAVQISGGTDHFPISQIEMVWTGSEFVAVWLSIYTADSSMRAVHARVAADGTVAAAESQITDETTMMLGPAITWTGSEYVTGWSDYRVSSENAELYLARHSADGTKVGADVLVAKSGDHEMLCDIAWSGSEIGMAWHDYASGSADVMFSRLDADLASVGTDLGVAVHATDSELSRSIVWTGSEYAIAWMQSATGDTDGVWDIYLGRVSAAAEKVGTDLLVSTGVALYDFPPIDWDGTRFGTGWTTGAGTDKEVEFALVDAGGTAIGDAYPASGDDGSESEFPGLTGLEGLFAFGWKDARHGASEIYLSILGPCEE